MDKNTQHVGWRGDILIQTPHHHSRQRHTQSDGQWLARGLAAVLAQSGLRRSHQNYGNAPSRGS